MEQTGKILATLRRELREGHYGRGDRYASEQSLMNRFKVSRPTINRLTDQLVLEGFLVRGKQGSGTRVLNPSPFPLGEIAYFGNVTHKYYAQMFDGACRAAYGRDYGLSFFSPKGELVNHCFEQVSSGHYVGALACSYGRVPDSFGKPVVYLDSMEEPNGRALATVTCTNYQGGCAMAEAVLSRGHREVLVFSNYSSIEYNRKQRIAGFREAMRRHGIADGDQRLFWEPTYEHSSLNMLFKRMVQAYPRTTVIMTDCDDLTFHLRNWLRGMGLAEQIAVTGFGNVDSMQRVAPFPTVEQHPEEIGLQGVRELLSWVENPQDFVPRTIEVETELVNADLIPVR